MTQKDMDRFTDLYERYMDERLKELSEAELQELVALFNRVASQPSIPDVILRSIP